MITNDDKAVNSTTIADSDDPIVAIDFTPNSNKGPGRVFRLRWFHFFILLFTVTAGIAGWFTLTAKSVFVDVDPITAEVVIEGGFSIKLAQRYLMRPGTYSLSLENPGYHNDTSELVVGDDAAQSHPRQMRKLPGIVTIEANDLQPMRVKIDGVDVGSTPILDLSVEPGEHTISLSRDRFLPYEEAVTIEGREVRQQYTYELNPAWAVVNVSSQPAGADIYVDGEVVAQSPSDIEILQGRRDVMVRMPGHKAWQDDLQIAAGEDFSLPLVLLEPADGLVFVRSQPANAAVTINGEYKGQTPLEVALPPDTRHEISLFKNGFLAARTSVNTAAEQEKEVLLTLQPELASVNIITEPSDAELYVNGELRGSANQTIELMASTQQLEIRREGYVPYTTEFTARPGLPQIVRVSLKSEEQARLERIKPMITTVAGQELKLLYPGEFTMGASRREAGRRSNESLRDIKMERPFYLSLAEVSNQQFKLFKADHSSGTLQGRSLDTNSQPVVQVTWEDAALYTNWLSEQEGLEPFYRVTGSEITGINAESTGYRLPTEAEWAWAARKVEGEPELKYPWGELLPPPNGAGNFADMSARSYLGEIVINYDDGFLGTAPIGEFTANHHGLFDMAGNVSEWVHDYYATVASSGSSAEVDPLGPEQGQYHTIRGSSWAHGSVTELRLSFRDYHEDASDEVGFRVARYLDDEE